MSMTIIDALKAKGSTGGNTIMEAIENLPGGGSGGGGVAIFEITSENDNDKYILHATFNELSTAFRNGSLVSARYTSMEDGAVLISMYNIMGLGFSDASHIYMSGFDQVSGTGGLSDITFMAASPDVYME